MALTPTFTISAPTFVGTKNSLTDYKWAVEDLINIGEPKMEEHFAQIPFGREYDLSRNMMGFPMFTTREMEFKLGLKKPVSPTSWNAYISNIRNELEGQPIKLTMDDDPDWYYQGTAHIDSFEAKRTLGTFTLKVHADAFKYYKTETTIVIPSPSATPMTTTVHLPDSPYPAEVSVVLDGGTQTFSTAAYMQWTLNGKLAWHNFLANSALMDWFTVPLLYSKCDNYGYDPELEFTRGQWNGCNLLFKIRKRSL